MHEPRPQDAYVEPAVAREALLCELRADVGAARRGIGLERCALVDALAAAQVVDHRDRARQHEPRHARTRERGEELARGIDRVALLLRCVRSKRCRAVHDDVVSSDELVQSRVPREVRAHDARLRVRAVGAAAHERRHGVAARKRRAHDGPAKEAAGTGDKDAHVPHYTAPVPATPAPRPRWRSTKLLQ